jgi:hypothetical protein
MLEFGSWPVRCQHALTSRTTGQDSRFAATCQSFRVIYDPFPPQAVLGPCFSTGNVCTTVSGANGEIRGHEQPDVNVGPIIACGEERP